MSRKDVENELRRETRSTDSTESAIKLSHWLWDNDVNPSHDGLKRSEIEEKAGDDLEYTVSTVLTHLVDAGAVEEFTQPGPDTLAIGEWLDDGDGEVINGEVNKRAEEALEALAQEIESDKSGSGTATAATDGGGESLRNVLAQEFALVPQKVEDFLRSTTQAVDTLNAAVEAIEESDEVEVGEDYGAIIFINMPYQYRLTEEAKALYMN